MTTKKAITLWIIAFVLMAILAAYQRRTGPTYDKSGSVDIGGQQIKFSLPRSHGGDGGEPVKIEVPDLNMSGKITFKRYKSNDEWKTLPMQRFGKELMAEIPHQPPAGKIVYDVMIVKDNKGYELTKEPVIIRFKSHVPMYFLIPHIIFIFMSMVFSTRTGLEALFNGKNSYSLTFWTCIIMFIGGIIFGPIIQKYAFDAYWTGWPFGHDLTDNKTLLAFIMWLIALWRLRKNKSSMGWVIAAAIVQIAVFMIPHSVLGSEIDYNSIPPK